MMTYCAFNSIFHSSFGRSVSINDTDCIELRRLFKETFIAFASVKTMLWNVFPFPLRLFPSLFKPYKVLEIRKNRSELIRKLIKQREEQYDTKNPVSYIDHMLKAMESNQITRY